MPSPRMLLGRGAVLCLLLVGGLLLGGCANSYLDDFPEDENAAPFLANQELMRKRIAAANQDQSGRRSRAMAERQAKQLAEWRKIQQRQDEGLRRYQALEARRAAGGRQRVDTERAREWRRIMQ